MKKFFTILCVVLLGFSSSAQVQWGASLGLNFSNIGGSDAPSNTKMRPGIRIGVSTAIPLSDVMTLKTGLIYSVKGLAYDTDPSSSQSLNYMEIPMDLYFMLGERFSLYAGPYLAFLTGSSIYIDGDGTSVDTDDISGLDLGLNFGASINATDAFSINLGYQTGFISVDDSGSDLSTTNNALVLGLNYAFGGGY